MEICKLRLFLKLVAEVEPGPSKPNLGLEPLPDIDFNIRAGNTLVGFASHESLKRHFSEASHGQQRMLSTEETALIARIDETAEIADRAYQRFREMQTAYEMPADQFLEAKKELRRRLKELGDELDRYLAADYGIHRPRFKNTKEWDNAFFGWRASHQPFHWLIEFYGIMRSGGFDAIIGNPPYVELTAVTQYRTINYQCTGAGNLYAFVMERSCGIAAPGGYVGFIVPVSSVSTDRYESLQVILRSKSLHYSSYDDRPSRLFDGLEHIRLTIHIIKNGESDPTTHSTRYNKWTSIERTELFKTLGYKRSTHSC